MNDHCLTAQPLISIITIVKNDPVGLERTLDSIAHQVYSESQLIIIDGASSDKTIEVINKFSSAIETWISEPDLGIYHAMNKGIELAKGDWLLFLNAGDEFATNDSLSAAASLISSEFDIIYSDWIYREDKSRVKASYSKMNVRHQSILYRKSLHKIFGIYLVGSGVTISDFVFFLSISNRYWIYCEQPISICDKSGASGKSKHFYQRMAAELMFGRRSRMNVAMILLIYPLYRFFKRNVIGSL